MQSKIILWDIETLPNIMARFSIWHQGAPEAIIKESSIICVSYRYLGESKIHTVSVLDDKKRFKKDVYDDYYVVSKMSEVFSDADLLIAHNGDKFDTKVLKARCLANKVDFWGKTASIDTLKIAKKHFKFNSNKLSYLAEYLKIPNKKASTSLQLWLDCMKGDKKAIKNMILYNKQDIRVLEEVYRKLLPYIDNHPHRGIMVGKGRESCRHCGGKQIVKRGYYYSTAGKYQNYRCKECGLWGTYPSMLKT